MQRRGFVAALTLAGLALPQAVSARPRRGARRPPEPRRLALQFVHTGAWFRGPFHNGQEYDRGAVEEFSRVVADHRTQEVHLVDPPLMDALWRLGQVMRAPELKCVSGYRSVTSNRLVGGVDDSTHLIAKAADLWFPADKLAEAVERAVALRAGGVGAYPTFLHVDVGPIRFWDRRPAPPECGEACAVARSAPGAAPNVMAAAPPRQPPSAAAQVAEALREPVRPRRTPIEILPDVARGGAPGSPLSLPGIGW